MAKARLLAQMAAIKTLIEQKEIELADLYAQLADLVEEGKKMVGKEAT